MHNIKKSVIYNFDKGTMYREISITIIEKADDNIISLLTGSKIHSTIIGKRDIEK